MTNGLYSRLDESWGSGHFQLKYVAWLIPAFRQISATGIPSLPCFRMNAFCASENFDAFIALRSFPASGNNRKTLAKNDPVFRDQSTLVTNAASQKSSRPPNRHRSPPPAAVQTLKVIGFTIVVGQCIPCIIHFPFIGRWMKKLSICTKHRLRIV